MSCTDFNAALDELVDGTLAPDARARVEAHLETCASCRAAARDLRLIRETARALPQVEPPADGWARLSASLDKEPAFAALRQRRGATTELRPAVPEFKPGVSELEPSRATATSRKPSVFAAWRPAWTALAAAAIVVLALSTALVLYRAGGTGGGPAGATQTAAPVESSGAQAGHAATTDLVQTVETELQLAEQHYQNAITGLEKVWREGEGTLDPTTAAVLTKNLGVIDQAVRESREALRAQPANEVAQATLFEALRRKVELLKDTVSLINEMRKGNQAGAAQIVGSLER